MGKLSFKKIQYMIGIKSTQGGLVEIVGPVDVNHQKNFRILFVQVHDLVTRTQLKGNKVLCGV